jgi:hypothetical protein
LPPIEFRAEPDAFEFALKHTRHDYLSMRTAVNALGKITPPGRAKIDLPIKEF